MCASALVAAGPLSAQVPGPCETDSGYRDLDFLLGEWRLVAGGATVGHSRVEKLEDGCLIAETWSFVDGRSGRTYAAFDPDDGEWRRFTASNRGVIVSSDGAVDGDEMVIDGLYFAADGEMSYWHERFTRMGDGRIARLAGTSRRVGRGERPRTVLFQGHYVPAGRPVGEPSAPTEPGAGLVLPSALVESPEPPPVGALPADARSAPQSAAVASPSTAAVAAASESEPAAVPAPEPATELPAPAAALAGRPSLPASAASEPMPAAAARAAGEVTAESARAVDAAAIERIAMASPMVLRVPLGAVEALPEGYGWITRDTAPYLCEGVTIEGVQVERRPRRGRVELEVEVAVHGRRAAQRVSIGVDLRRGGRPDTDDAVASGSAAGRVGRNIPEQIEHGSVAFELPLSMDAAAFDEIVADVERPELVVTLTVGR